MEAPVRKRRTTYPISHHWNMVKDLDDSQKEDDSLKPYAIEEIHAMIDQSERDIAEGRVYDFDDAMEDLEKEFAEEERKLEMAEVV